MRNKPCSCGSGKKYKHCCGAPVKVHIERLSDDNMHLLTFEGMIALTDEIIQELSTRWRIPSLREQLLSIVPVCEHGSRLVYYCEERDSIVFPIDDETCEISEHHIRLHSVTV